MTLLHDKDRREALRLAKARVRELEAPEREAARIRAAKARRDRERAIDRSQPTQRKPRELDGPYLQWLRRQACCVGPIMGDPCSGRIDPAHIRFSDAKVGRINPGAGRKSDDKWCLPVCRKHHDAQHAYGNEAKWWAVEVGADPSDYAIAHHAAFEAGEGNAGVVRQFSPTRTA